MDIGDLQGVCYTRNVAKRSVSSDQGRWQNFSDEDQQQMLECSSLWRNLFSICHSGLRKWTSRPLMTIIQIAPVTTEMLSNVPKTPKVQFRNQNNPYFCGFLMIIHMKLGYAKVMGSATPPISPAKLGKNGSATAMNEARHPKKTLNAERNQRGHGLFTALVYLNSKLSNTGMAYIWKELRQLITTKTLVIPRRNFDVSRLWNLYIAVNNPSFETGIWCQIIQVINFHIPYLSPPSYLNYSQNLSFANFSYQISIRPIASNCKRKQTHCNDKISKLHSFPHRYTRWALNAGWHCTLPKKKKKKKKKRNVHEFSQ